MSEVLVADTVEWDNYQVIVLLYFLLLWLLWILPVIHYTAFYTYITFDTNANNSYWKPHPQLYDEISWMRLFPTPYNCILFVFVDLLLFLYYLTPLPEQRISQEHTETILECKNPLNITSIHVVPLVISKRQTFASSVSMDGEAIPGFLVTVHVLSDAFSLFFSFLFINFAPFFNPPSTHPQTTITWPAVWRALRTEPKLT